MRLALMQPYFFPYVGYFSLIAAVDTWVVFDDAQFIKGGWIQRNRVLAPDDDWQWIRVPIRKHPHEARIGDVEIADDPKWRSRLERQLDVYRHAPHFEETRALVAACLAVEASTVAALDVATLGLVCEHLSVRFDPVLLSASDFDASTVHGPGDWGLEVCRHFGADAYVNPIGGRDLFDPEAFAAAGVDLRFLQAREVPYDQARAGFVPWLSIIDVLMWNDRDTVRSMLEAVDVG